MALLHMATLQPERVEAMVLVSATSHFPEQARAIMRGASFETMPPDVREMYRECARRGDTQIRQLIGQFNALHINHARAAVVHRDRAVAERARRDQLEASRARQAALVQRRAVAGDPGVDEEPVLVDQVQPVQRGRELAAAEEHAGRGRVLERLHARAQVAGDVVAVGPREVGRVDDTTYFGLASSLTAHSRIAGGADTSPRATAGQ
jgi:hypothetical protein